MPSPNVLIIQMGARRRYELAEMLGRQGMLAALQTSAAWTKDRPPSWLLRTMIGRDSGAISRRTIGDVDSQKIYTTFLPELIGAGLRALAVETERRYQIEDWFLGYRARKISLRDVNIILNTGGNGGLQYLKAARAQGVKIATEVFITPLVYEILSDEQARWPGWESDATLHNSIIRYRRHWEELVLISDLLICPSDIVVEGLGSIRGFDAAKVVKIPYALGGALPARKVSVPKRILFAGEAGLRKGLPYLAQAARQLRAEDPDVEVRVAGLVSDSIRSRPDCSDVTFLGHLGPAQMSAEFETADVFCLPSLAEGMAAVTLEAMARGIPCVVTKSTGAPVQHGVEGLIVPEREPAALAGALKSVINNRTIREGMSSAAMALAVRHNPAAIGELLAGALRKLTGDKA